MGEPRAERRRVGRLERRGLRGVGRSLVLPCSPVHWSSSWARRGGARRINGAPQMRWCYPNGETVPRDGQNSRKAPAELLALKASPATQWGCPSREGQPSRGAIPPELMAPPKCVGAIRMVRLSREMVKIRGCAPELMAPPKCVGAIRMVRLSREMVKFADVPPN